MFSIALVVASVRRSERGKFNLITVSVLSNPSRKICGALS